MLISIYKTLRAEGAKERREEEGKVKRVLIQLGTGILQVHVILRALHVLTIVRASVSKGRLQEYSCVGNMR